MPLLPFAISSRATAPFQPWRAFAARRYRAYQAIAGGQAIVFAFATDAFFVPFLLALGADPAFATLVGILPVVGSIAQGLIPRALKRWHGNLRTLTITLTIIGETRGFWLALVATGVATGFLDMGMAVLLTGLIVAVAGSAAIVAEATLLSWMAIVLPENDRRWVAPKVMAVAMGASAILLIPAGIVLDQVAPGVTPWIYAALFAFAGVASLPLIAGVCRLRRPGKVTIRADHVKASESVELTRFTKASIWNSIGTGMTPYVAVFAVSVPGMTPGFAVILAGLWSAAALVAATVVGTFLATGSSSHVLRAAYLARVIGLLILVVALPGSPLAPAILVVSVILNSAGFTATVIAQNERLFRLTEGPATIAHQGRYVALNAGAYTASGAVLTVVTVVAERVGFLAWAGIFVASALPRLVAAKLTDVPPTWRTPVVATSASA